MTSMRDVERASIRGFLLEHADKLTGSVLDYGCGKQPYRDLVETAGGSYVGYDDPAYPASVVDVRTPSAEHVWPLAPGSSWETIICTQVIQYLREVQAYLADMRGALAPGGVLLITGPTNWPVVEDADLHRFTPKGIEWRLDRAGFNRIEVVERHHADFGGEEWCLGWAAVAYA